MSYDGPINDHPAVQMARCPCCGRQVAVGRKDKIETHSAAKNAVCPGSGLKAKRGDLRGGLK